MKPPRVFIKQGYFWIDFYLEGHTHSKRRSTGIVAEQVYINGKKQWTENKELAAKIRKEIRKWEDYRSAVSIGVVAVEPVKKRSKRITWDELLNEYNATNELETDEKSGRTIESRSHAVKFFTNYFPDIVPAAVTRETVLELRKDARADNYAPKSIKNYFQTLRSLFKFAIRQKYVTENPFTDIKIRVDPKDPATSELKNEYAVLTFAWVYKRPLFFQLMFQRLSGFRVSEVCRFLAEYIDTPHGVITYYNPKPHERIEKFPISKAMAALLSLMELPATGRIFEYRNRKTVNYYLGRACTFANLPKVTTHQLKRSYSQEWDPHCPDDRTYNMLIHHFPEANKIGVQHYTGRNLNRMREVLDVAQLHWLSFFDEIKSLPEDPTRYQFSNPKARKYRRPNKD